MFFETKFGCHVIKRSTKMGYIAGKKYRYLEGDGY